jgi:hypothetical protein
MQIFFTVLTFSTLQILIWPLQDHFAAHNLKKGHQYLKQNKDVPILLRGFDYDLYTLVQLYHLKPCDNRQIPQQLDKIKDHS